MRIFILNHGAGVYNKFENIPINKKIKSYNLQVISTSYLAQYFVAYLRKCSGGEHDCKHKGLICLTSSIMDKLCGPYSSMYSIGKAYTTALGTSLANEGALLGYDVLTLSPAPIYGTKFYTSSGMKDAPPALMRNLQTLSCSTTASKVADSIFRNAGRATYVPVGGLSALLHALCVLPFVRHPLLVRVFRRGYSPIQQIQSRQSGQGGQTGTR